MRIGEYQQGADPATDEAIAKIDAVNAFLRQGIHEKSAFEQTLQRLTEVVSGP